MHEDDEVEEDNNKSQFIHLDWVIMK